MSHLFNFKTYQIFQYLHYFLHISTCLLNFLVNCVLCAN